jgi:hypothetical protein
MLVGDCPVFISSLSFFAVIRVDQSVRVFVYVVVSIASFLTILFFCCPFRCNDASRSWLIAFRRIRGCMPVLSSAPFSHLRFEHAPSGCRLPARDRLEVARRWLTKVPHVVYNKRLQNGDRNTTCHVLRSVRVRGCSLDFCVVPTSSLRMTPVSRVP